MEPPSDGNKRIDPESLTRIFVRPLGSAMPVGFFAFGTGTLLSAALEMHWIPPTSLRDVALVMLGFVAPLELIACLFAFLSRDTAGATTMGIFAFSWVGFASVWLRTGTAQGDPVIGFFCIILAIMIIALASAAFSGKPLLALILLIAALRSASLAVAQLAGGAVWRSVAAIVALILTAFSIYGGLAFLIEDLKQRAVLPVFRRGQARESIEGSLRDQLGRISKEAGVRQQL